MWCSGLVDKVPNTNKRDVELSIAATHLSGMAQPTVAQQNVQQTQES
jgi:hypothetical protein